MVPQPHGGALKRGGPRPNAGRPKGTFRDFLRSVREDDTALRAAIERAARDPESRAFGHTLKLMRDYDPDAPERRVSVDGKVAHTLTLRVEYAPLTAPEHPPSIGSLPWGEDRR